VRLTVTDRSEAEHDSAKALFALAELGGTVPGEHGIGLSKLDSARQELAETLGLLQKIKDLFDLERILNGGKVN
jgi:FAD/FMN-containing dehydrogenase